MTLSVDKKGFVIKDGVKLPFKSVPQCDLFEFFDKELPRSLIRGTRRILVSAEEIISFFPSEGEQLYYCPTCENLLTVVFSGLERECEKGHKWSINPHTKVE